MRRKVGDTDDELHEEEKSNDSGIPCDQVVKEENEWEDGIT